MCTWINLRPHLWTELTDGALVSGATFYIDARLDLLHGRTLAAAGSGDLGYALAQQLLDMLGAVLRQAHPGPTPAPAPASNSDRALVSAAREAILADHPSARELIPLAALLAVSPFRLSRAFSREMGTSLTRYRNRVRVSRALHRLQQGDSNLAVLAHLCRTLRQHLNHTPSALRHLLRSSAGR